MKTYKIILLIFIIAGKLNAENKMHLGFSAGLAIPNENISRFFDDSRQHIQTVSIDGWGRYILDKATNIGYNIKMFGRISLSDNFIFVPSIGIARFNEGTYELVFPLGTDTHTAKTQSTANVVPISLGINGYLFKKFLSPYVNADLTYNYIAYSYDVVWRDNFAAPIVTSTTMSRLGYSIGAGIDIKLPLISLTIETKFNTINIIKHNDNEPTKINYTFSLGIIF